jgi:hypothetical protein
LIKDEVIALEAVMKGRIERPKEVEGETSWLRGGAIIIFRDKIRVGVRGKG